LLAISLLGETRGRLAAISLHPKLLVGAALLVAEEMLLPTTMMVLMLLLMLPSVLLLGVEESCGVDIHRLLLSELMAAFSTPAEFRMAALPHGKCWSPVLEMSASPCAAETKTEWPHQPSSRP
jgi:hypothetical protein